MSLRRIITGVLGRSLYCVCSPVALPLTCQTRNTFILKRRWPPRLSKSYKRPILKSRQFVYDLVEDTSTRRRENLDVILTSYVQGLGDKGDKVSLNENYAYNALLLPGLAVYASPENIKKFEKEFGEKTLSPKFSSPTAERAISILSKCILSVVMNKETQWTLQPWHICMSFRKAGFIVPQDAIEMPKNAIHGPDLNIEGKHFVITVTVNKTEKVSVQCRIHHWSTEPSDRLPYEEEFWKKPVEMINPKE